METARILVAEDAEDLIRIWRILFRTSTDYVVRFCTSGQTALEAIEGGFAPDVLVTDYFLGDITGEQLIEKVRVLVPMTRYIVATGNSDNEELQRLEAEGQILLLIKPIKFQELKNKIENLLQGRTEIHLKISESSFAVETHSLSS